MYTGKLATTPILLGIVCLIFFGCSGNSSMETPVTPAHMPEMNPGHSMLGIYELIIDTNAETVDVVAKRDAMMHFDVTPMLMDPAICPLLNCIQVQLISVDPVNHIFTILVTLRNPLAISGHDIRGIVYLNADHEHELLNYDAYTTSFGTPWYEFNPFIAFARDVEQRRFGPQAVHSASFELYIPPQPNPFAIDYAVDASWPGNCPEPYDITDQLQMEPMTDTYGSKCILSCIPHDWQDQINLNSVVVDGESISGTAILMEYNTQHLTWECILSNNLSAPPGEYDLSISAMAQDSFIRTRDYITVTIIESSSVPNVTGTVEAYSGGGPMPDVFVFCTDGENYFCDISDVDGQYELFDVPLGGRVISFNETGTIGQYHEIDLTIAGAVVDAEMPLVYLYVPHPPELNVNPPDVDVTAKTAIISGIVNQYNDNQKVIFIVNGEEELHESAAGEFSEKIQLHDGLNRIRIRASNAKGNTFSDWIEIDI